MSWASWRRTWSAISPGSMPTPPRKPTKVPSPKFRWSRSSKPGDLWILGNHRLLCGDATVLSDVERLMDGQLADMVFSDPPYNVDYGNGAKGKLQGKDRRILNDALGDGFYQFLYDACVNMLTVTKGACYICMSSSELHTLQRAFTDAGGKWSTFVIWAKNTFTLGRADYQRQYEPILYGWKQGADHFWCGARDQGDVWFVDKPRVNDLHPTMKPVELVERAIRNSSKSRDIVLDLFGGSGTTLIAAERTGRSARLLELDPRYVDVIVDALAKPDGGSGGSRRRSRTFNDLRVARRAVLDREATSLIKRRAGAFAWGVDLSHSICHGKGPITDRCRTGPVFPRCGPGRVAIDSFRGACGPAAATSAAKRSSWCRAAAGRSRARETVQYREYGDAPAEVGAGPSACPSWNAC